MIRRIFKDIGNLEMSANWFKIDHDLQFTYDVITTLILFFLIHLFYKKIEKQSGEETLKMIEGKLRIHKFIKLKKT